MDDKNTLEREFILATRSDVISFLENNYGYNENSQISQDSILSKRSVPENDHIEIPNLLDEEEESIEEGFFIDSSWEKRQF